MKMPVGGPPTDAKQWRCSGTPAAATKLWPPDLDSRLCSEFQATPQEMLVGPPPRDQAPPASMGTGPTPLLSRTMGSPLYLLTMPGHQMVGELNWMSPP